MAVEDSMASLLAYVADLEAALRPFAVLAQMYERRPDDVRLVSTAVGDITVGHLRRARRAVAD
jgi:hypothetical protein